MHFRKEMLDIVWIWATVKLMLNQIRSYSWYYFVNYVQLATWTCVTPYIYHTHKLKLQALTYDSSYKVPECDCIDIYSIHTHMLPLLVHLSRWDNQRCSGHTVAHHCNCLYLQRRTHAYDIQSWPTACVCAMTMNQKSCHTTLSDTVYKVSYRIFFHGRGNVDECNGRMCASVHPQGFGNFIAQSYMHWSQVTPARAHLVVTMVLCNLLVPQ